MKKDTKKPLSASLKKAHDKDLKTAREKSNAGDNSGAIKDVQRAITRACKSNDPSAKRQAAYSMLLALDAVRAPRKKKKKAL